MKEKTPPVTVFFHCRFVYKSVSKRKERKKKRKKEKEKKERKDYEHRRSLARSQ